MKLSAINTTGATKIVQQSQRCAVSKPRNLAVRCQATPNNEGNSSAGTSVKENRNPLGLGDVLGPIGLTVGKSMVEDTVSTISSFSTTNIINSNPPIH